MEKIPFKKFLPGIAWFFIVLVLTCMPGNDVPKIGWLENLNFDKWVHAGMFGGLTFLFSFPFFKSGFSNIERLHYFIRIALAASIWGLAIEFIQKYFVISRDFDLLDWAADSVGAAIALWFCRYCNKKYYQRTQP
ncbi:MAG: VanZ family protein [Ginsengibacter sp.]